MVRTVFVALVCLAIAAPAFAQYGGSSSGGQAVAELGAYNSARDRFYVTNVTVEGLKGVWLMEGMETPNSQVIAGEDNTMPDCESDGTLPNYEGLDFDAARYLVLAGSPNVNLMNVNQQRSTFASNATYSSGIIGSTNVRTGAVSCVHFQPYVDVATGKLMADSVTMSVFYPNTTQGARGPIRDRPTCYLTGREQVGCYPAGTEVALGAPLPSVGSPSSAPSVAVTSIPGIAPQPSRPADAVVTVSRNTFQCEQGECLRLSPKHSSSSPVYGG